jgi:hypothetical protein
MKWVAVTIWKLAVSLQIRPKNKIGHRRKIRPNKAKKGHNRPQQATKGLFLENKVKNIFPPNLLVPENE